MDRPRPTSVRCFHTSVVLPSCSVSIPKLPLCFAVLHCLSAIAACYKSIRRTENTFRIEPFPERSRASTSETPRRHTIDICCLPGVAIRRGRIHDSTKAYTGSTGTRDRVRDVQQCSGGRGGVIRSLSVLWSRYLLSPAATRPYAAPRQSRTSHRQYIITACNK